MDKTIKISEKAYKKLNRIKLDTKVPIKHIVDGLLDVPKEKNK